MTTPTTLTDNTGAIAPTSNAKTHQYGTGPIVMHYTTEKRPREGAGACGISLWSSHFTSNRARVTCKRCLASLVRRDREFQRKARRQFRDGPARLRSYCAEAAFQELHGRTTFGDATRAIAREEGRAP